MATIVPITVHADGLTWKVRCIFRSRLWRIPHLSRLWDGVGGLTLSRSTVRFKRDRAIIPLHMIGHELVHCQQARRLGWRYLPRYLWLGLRHGFAHERHPMEVEATRYARSWEHNGQRWEGPAYPLPRSWHVVPRITWTALG